MRRITIALTYRDIDAFEIAAKKAGITPSQYLRNIVDVRSSERIRPLLVDHFPPELMTPFDGFLNAKQWREVKCHAELYGLTKSAYLRVLILRHLQALQYQVKAA